MTNKMLRLRQTSVGVCWYAVRRSLGLSSDNHLLHRDKVYDLKPSQWLNLEFPFPSVHAPKGFEFEIQKTNSIKFFLTEQRLSLLKECDEQINLGGGGFALAGPHGLGKSAVSTSVWVQILKIYSGSSLGRFICP
jgi:hypothetical protein